MNPLLAKLALRFAVPLIGVIGLCALGDPLPQVDASVDARIVALAEAAAQVAPIWSEEIDLARSEVQEGAAELRRAAANMRWLVTLPAARSRRCDAPECAG